MNIFPHYNESTLFFLKGTEYSVVQMYHRLNKHFLEMNMYVDFEYSS